MALLPTRFQPDPVQAKADSDAANAATNRAYGRYGGSEMKFRRGQGPDTIQGRPEFGIDPQTDRDRIMRIPGGGVAPAGDSGEIQDFPFSGDQGKYGRGERGI